MKKRNTSNSRRHNRTKAVLPVRVIGSDSSGESYNDLAHTLDINEDGARLGAVHRILGIGSQLVLQYRQYRAEFRVVWIKSMPGTREHQVGLEALSARDVWGLALGLKSQPVAAPSATLASPPVGQNLTA